MILCQEPTHASHRSFFLYIESGIALKPATSGVFINNGVAWFVGVMGPYKCNLNINNGKLDPKETKSGLCDGRKVKRAKIRSRE